MISQLFVPADSIHLLPYLFIMMGKIKPCFHRLPVHMFYFTNRKTTNTEIGDRVQDVVVKILTILGFGTMKKTLQFGLEKWLNMLSLIGYYSKSLRTVVVRRIWSVEFKFNRWKKRVIIETGLEDSLVIFLKKNLIVFCSCPRYLYERIFKDDRLISLMEKISRLHNIVSGLWLMLLIVHCKIKQCGRKNVKHILKQKMEH